MNKTILALTAALLATSPVARAGSLAYGTQELRVNGQVDIHTAGGTALGLELGYGYFLYDYLEVGAFVGYFSNDFVDDLYAGLFSEYNFETGTEWIPFAGAQLRLLNTSLETAVGDESNTALAIGFYGGCKYFLTDNVAISARLLLEAATDDVYIDEDEATNNDFTIDLGLRFFF